MVVANRRVTIKVEVEEQTDRYSWNEVAKSELTSSLAMFDAPTAARAITTAIEQLMERPSPTNLAGAPSDMSDIPF